jgi:predicted phage baseplate assembly protein
VNSAAIRKVQFGAAAPADPGGEVWRQVSSFAGAQPHSRVYVVSTHADGSTYVNFGDGVHGARLPTGSENVIASYRSGAGASGNVSPGSLIVLRSRPAGVRTVTNPTAAAGGADAESMESLASLQRLRWRCLDRIVTLSDYAAFAREFPGVEKAHAAWLQTDQPAVCLSIAATRGRPVTELPDLREALRKAVLASRVDNFPLLLEGFRITAFDLAVRIFPEPPARTPALLEAAEAALQRAFSLANREFAQPVTAHEVQTVLAAVKGVRAVTVDSLFRAGENASRQAVLTAAEASWDPWRREVIPVEVLILGAGSITAEGGLA